MQDVRPKALRIFFGILPFQAAAQLAEPAKDLQAAKEMDYAIEQIRDLIEGGADGIHIYAMNNAAVVRDIYKGISDLL